jgi:hypothetical protein
MLPASTVHSPSHYTSATSLCSHHTCSYDIGSDGTTIPLNIFTRELDCLNYNSPVIFQLCAAEKVNTDHYFTIQVHFKLGLQGTAISDGRQISQLKCHLGMDRGDHSLRQHKGRLRNQNYYLGGAILFMYF